MEKIRVFFDMDDVLCYYTDAMNYARHKYPDQKYPQAQLDFFRNLKANPYAVKAFREMNDPNLNGDIFDPWILTAPSMMNPLSYTEKRIWTEQQIGMWAVEKLIIAPDKSLLKGHILIDDQRKGRGQDRFDGVLIVPEEYGTWGDIVSKCFTVAASYGVGYG